MVSRREWLRMTVSGAMVAAAGGAVPAFAMSPVAITVYKDPSCGCCKKWVEHLRTNGFAVTTRDMNDLSEVKATFGVPRSLQACHTATTGTFVVEGHVPADVIRKMLSERPKIAGIAVPGMPSGSPGMEGGAPDHYDVIAFSKNGATSVYAKR
ncbi:MAG TPA: DUF411 domain-containing protein [Gemmatimonadaceae bacterium]|jgi:hypothetical protein|nr:DUF411 domain-containing protein [Tepidiformaceae bacterium]